MNGEQAQSKSLRGPDRFFNPAVMGKETCCDQFAANLEPVVSHVVDNDVAVLASTMIIEQKI